MEEIRICSNHSDYEVPLQWTFAFMGSEYWCPYCGADMGMLGAGEQVESTPELEKRAKIYKEKSGDFLHAKRSFYASRTKWEGEWVQPKDLPEKEKGRLAQLRKDGWKYETKAEKL